MACSPKSAIATTSSPKPPTASKLPVNLTVLAYLLKSFCPLRAAHVLKEWIVKQGVAGGSVDFKTQGLVKVEQAPEG